MNGDKKGKKREAIAGEVLGALKKGKVICDYLLTSPFDYNDVRGADVIVTAVPNVMREDFPLQITGPLWTEEHYLKHPEHPVVSVNLETAGAALRQFIVAQTVGAIVLESLRRKNKLLSFRPESHMGRTGMSGVTSSFHIVTKEIVMRRVNIGVDLPYLVSAESPRDLVGFDAREGREALHKLLLRVEQLL